MQFITKPRKALFMSLIGVILVSGMSLLLDGMKYHQVSLLLKFESNLPSQLSHTAGDQDQNIASIKDAQAGIQLRISIDISIFLLASFGLWSALCVPKKTEL
jgi:hypothetical protein